MKYSVVCFVLGLVATLAMVVNISCSTRNQEQNLATKIRWKMQEEQIRLTDLGFNIWSKTITNDVVWKDNDGKLLDVSRGGKISYIDGIFWWVGRKPSSSSNVSIRQYYTYTYTYCVHLLLVAFTPTRTCPPKIIPILSITMEETLFSHICDHSKLLPFSPIMLATFISTSPTPLDQIHGSLSEGWWKIQRKNCCIPERIVNLASTLTTALIIYIARTESSTSATVLTGTSKRFQNLPIHRTIATGVGGTIVFIKRKATCIS